MVVLAAAAVGVVVVVVVVAAAAAVLVVEDKGAESGRHTAGDKTHSSSEDEAHMHHVLHRECFPQADVNGPCINQQKQFDNNASLCIIMESEIVLNFFTLLHLYFVCFYICLYIYCYLYFSPIISYFSAMI